MLWRVPFRHRAHVRHHGERVKITESMAYISLRQQYIIHDNMPVLAGRHKTIVRQRPGGRTGRMEPGRSRKVRAPPPTSVCDEQFHLVSEKLKNTCICYTLTMCQALLDSLLFILSLALLQMRKLKG